ncbi:MAG: hypothetical protein HOC23_20180 [Halieaceae bacterium]|nr:hypothetical protein [Halieaceae bacterium]
MTYLLLKGDLSALIVRCGHLLLLLAMMPISQGYAANQRQLTFIHLNDIHANLMPHEDRVRRTAGDDAFALNESRGGLARTATLIRQIREQAANTVLMNIGDTYHGGVEALYSRGNAIVAPVDALGIDIGVPGNWDFAYGPLVTRLRYSQTNPWLSRLVNKLVSGEPVQLPIYPVIAGNVRQTFKPLLENEPLLPATHVQTFGDVSVGFIGITSDIVPRMSPLLAWGFTFLEGEEAYRKLINQHTRQLREAGAELVVVMSELGLHRDRQLANVIDPGVSVFFSAHTHEVTEQPLSSSSGALVVEAGNDGYLGEMTVTLSHSGPPVFNWKLLAIDASVPMDPAMQRLVEDARAPFLGPQVAFDHPMPFVDLPLEESIDTVIAKAPITLHRRAVLNNPFNHYLAEQMRRHYDADLALTPGFRFDAVVEEGSALTLEELYRYLPVPPHLAKARVRGDVLRRVFETELTRAFSKDAFAHSGGWFMGVAGLDLDVDLSRKDGDRVLHIYRAGSEREINPEEYLTVISCSRPYDEAGVLCSNGGFEDVTVLPSPTASEWTPLEFARYALLQGGIDGEGTGRVRDISATPVWPTAQFMQPLHQVP